MVTHASCLHGDDFRVACQFAGEIDDGDEDEQRAEHIHVIRDQGQIVVEDDFLQRHLIFKEIVHLLREIEYDGYRQNEHDREEERAQEFFDNIVVKPYHIRCIIAGMTDAFHALKSPARMCSRACVTRSR